MVGYDAGNKPAISPTFICRLCSLILRNPAQLECGHRQCKSCIDAIIGEIIRCAACSEESSKANVRVDKGFKNDMQSLAIVCVLCAWQGPLKAYDNHLLTEHSRPLCNFCAQQCESAAYLAYHKLHECQKITVSCALKDYGCVNDVVRVEMAKHYLTVEHQAAIAGFVRAISVRPMDTQSGDNTTMDVDFISSVHTTVPGPSQRNTVSQLQNGSEIKEVLADGMNTLKGDLTRLEISRGQCDQQLISLQGELEKLKLSVEEQNASVSSVGPSQNTLLQEVQSMKQKFMEFREISYDGTLLWKITNVTEIINEAKAGRQAFISSIHFFSSLSGYKMQGRLYPVGDGNARGSHMSLFFVLMRSDYDPILRFPFPYKITFCLYDQTATQRHLIDSFRPDPKSPSFQRPKSERNTASGIPKFVSLQTIQQENSPYVRDDTIYIKIFVDFIDLPKNLISYAVSLDSSLPASVQQTLIKEEEQRRAKQSSGSSLSSKVTSQKS